MEDSRGAVKSPLSDKTHSMLTDIPTLPSLQTVGRLGNPSKYLKICASAFETEVISQGRGPKGTHGHFLKKVRARTSGYTYPIFLKMGRQTNLLHR